MPSIQDIRKQYPQYNDLSDEAFADALHQKFYADMPRAEFDAKIGLVQPQAAATAPVDRGVTGARRGRLPKGPQIGTGFTPVQARPWGELGEEYARGTDDFVRSVASGATFGLADEAAALAASGTGIGRQAGAGDDYASNLAAERTRDAAIPKGIKIPGEVVGGLATGRMLANTGLTLLKTANPTVGNLTLRGAGEGAAYGAAHGAGHGEGAQDRLERAAYGATLGAATGAATGAVAGKLVQGSKAKVPTTEEIKAQSRVAYKAADDAGVVIAPDRFGAAVDDIASMLKKEGYHPKLHPRIATALEELQAAKGSATALEQTEIYRRIIGNAGSSADASERRLAGIMTEKLDDFVEGLGAKDIVSGDASGAKALEAARDLWKRARKSETIEELFGKAELRAAQPSGPSIGNALRSEFIKLARSDARMRRFTAEEREAIRKVALGGPIENLLRQLAKFAPNGLTSTVLSGGAGYLAGGAAGSVAVPAVGLGARTVATSMTERNARLAAELMRTGGSPRSLPRALSPEQAALFGALLVGQAQQVPPQVQRRAPLSTAR